jgi:putative membrane protein insertion efficiency factor
MKLLTYPFLILIRGWQKFIAPGLSPRCKYYPSCSHYAFDAIKRYNLIGLLLGAWRIIRCNPLSYGGVDYVPESIKLGPIKLGAR